MSNNFLQPSAAQRMLHPFLEQRSVNCRENMAAIFGKVEGKPDVFHNGLLLRRIENDLAVGINTEKPDMVLMQLEMPMQTAIDTYRMAKAQGIPVFLDAGPAQKVPLKEFQGILVISPNEAETCAMTGIRVTDEASALRAAWEIYQRALPQYVLLKLGARGALLYDGKTGRRFPARKVRAVDTTAAGDTFNAAVCFRLCQGDSLERSIAFANAAAAITVSRRGALTSIPTEAEVTALISGTDNG